MKPCPSKAAGDEPKQKGRAERVESAPADEAAGKVCAARPLWWSHLDGYSGRKQIVHLRQIWSNTKMSKKKVRHGRSATNEAITQGHAIEPPGRSELSPGVDREAVTLPAVEDRSKETRCRKKLHLDANEYASLTGTNMKIAYRDLQPRSVLVGQVIRTSDVDRKKGPPSELDGLCGLFRSRRAHRGEFQRIDQIHQPSPSCFTTIGIEDVAKFKSFYAIRFYELMMR